MTVMIRPATTDDYPAYVRLFPALAVDDPPPPKDMFRRMAPTTLIAERDGVAAGCLVYQKTPPEGFVNQLIIDPAWQAQGIGGQLMLHAAGIMRAAGCETWALNVKQRNAPARKLYHRMGMSPAHETAALRMAWADIAALKRSPDGDQIRNVTDEQRFDGRIEASFGMKSGWLDRLREGGEIVLMLAMRNDQLTGFAGFRPEFPSILAFNACSEESAAGLLQTAMTYRRSLDVAPGCWRQDQVKIIVQRQPHLVADLRRHGADLHHMLDLMRGPLPAVAGTNSKLGRRKTHIAA